MSKRIFLSFIYGPRNAGDMALNYGALEVLKCVGDFDVVGLSRFAVDHPDFERTKEQLEGYYPNFRLIPFPVSYDRHTQSRAGQMISYLQGARLCLPFGSSGGEIHQELSRSDFMLFNGGNLLFARNMRDLLRLVGVVYPVRMARDLGRPVGFLPQSLPNSGLWAGKRMMRAAFRQAAFVYFRESMSMEQFRPSEFGDMRSFLDMAFFIGASNAEAARRRLQEHGIGDVPFVPIIVRSTTLGDHQPLDESRARHTVQTVVQIHDELRRHGIQPVFVVQTQADLDITRRCRDVLARNGASAAIIEEYHPLVLRAIYALARGIVTFRLHAAIFALSVGTPAIGIYRSIWGQKMPATYADLDVADLCLDLEAAGSEIPSKVALLRDRNTAASYGQAVQALIQARKQELVDSLRLHLATDVTATAVPQLAGISG